jgi:hypothetical protein
VIPSVKREVKISNAPLESMIVAAKKQRAVKKRQETVKIVISSYQDALIFYLNSDSPCLSL